MLGGPQHDILTELGLVWLIRELITVLPRGTIWWGLPCCIWVWTARGHTQRSRRSPWGDRSRDDVRSANRMVSIVTALFKLLILRDVYHVCEQPSSSIVWAYKPMRQHLFERPRIGNVRLSGVHVWLGFWGHILTKGTHLVGIFPGLRKIKSKRTKRNPNSASGQYGWVRGSIRKSGPRKGTFRIMGCKRPGASLRETGEYPMLFCEHMMALIKSALRCRHSK